MSFTVFIYNATVLLIQPNHPTRHMCWKMRPNPTHGWTQPMSISGLRCQHAHQLIVFIRSAPALMHFDDYSSRQVAVTFSFTAL